MRIWGRRRAQEWPQDPEAGASGAGGAAPAASGGSPEGNGGARGAKRKRDDGASGGPGEDEAPGSSGGDSGDSGGGGSGGRDGAAAGGSAQAAGATAAGSEGPASQGAARGAPAGSQGAPEGGSGPEPQESRECSVCLCGDTSGFGCAEGHFVCEGCFLNYLNHACSPEVGRVSASATVPCPLAADPASAGAAAAAAGPKPGAPAKCRAPPYGLAQLAGRVPADTLAAIVKARTPQRPQQPSARPPRPAFLTPWQACVRYPRTLGRGAQATNHAVERGVMAQVESQRKVLPAASVR